MPSGDDAHAIGRAAPGPWRGTVAALCATLVGIGLARFAYTPLIPALIEADWFTPADAAYLGAVNLAGYLAGAVSARHLAVLAPERVVLRASMVLATLSFFACAFPLSFSWYFAWRFLAGATGGTLMVLAPAAALRGVPAGRRGLAGGIIFTGVGLGIAASGLLVPILLAAGLVETWIGIGALAALLTLASFGGWHNGEARGEACGEARGRDQAPAGARGARRFPPAVYGLFAAYALLSMGLVPHMVFLSDFVARGLGQGVDAGAHYWALFGLGAIFGPVIAGRIADRFGFGLTLRVVLVIQAACVGGLALTPGPVALVLSSLLVGAFVPGVVPLVLGRIHELMGGDEQGRVAAWSIATAGFALGQTAAAYACSVLFDLTGRFDVLFAAGATALILAFAVDAGTRRRPDRA